MNKFNLTSSNVEVVTYQVDHKPKPEKNYLVRALINGRKKKLECLFIRAKSPSDIVPGIYVRIKRVLNPIYKIQKVKPNNISDGSKQVSTQSQTS